MPTPPNDPALATWRILQDELLARGWGDRFSDYAPHALTLARIARQYKESPEKMGALLRQEFDATSDLHTRIVLALILMTVRSEGEPFLLAKMDAATESLDKLLLAGVLRSPRDLLPTSDDTGLTVFWKDLLLGVAIIEGQVATIAQNVREGRFPYGMPRGDPRAGETRDPERPVWTATDNDNWVRPTWYTSPEAAEAFKKFALREADSWVRYSMYEVLRFSAKAGNQETGLWMAEQFDEEYVRYDNSWGAVAYGTLSGLGPDAGVTKVTDWILAREGHFVRREDQLYLLDAIEATQGNAAWPVLERVYPRIQDGLLREDLIRRYFCEFNKTAPPEALGFLRREALGGMTPGIRGAALVVLGTGKYPDAAQFTDVLLRGLDDPESEVRISASLAVKQLGIRASVPRLAALAEKATTHAEQLWYVRALEKLDRSALQGIQLLPETR